MFATAIDLARQFTKPVIVSMRFFDGSVSCALGAFFILNDQGWIITVAHILEPLSSFDQHKSQIAIYNQQKVSIQNNASLIAKRKSKQLARLQSNAKWITDISYWWAYPGKQVNSFQLLPEADLAIGQLSPFQSGDCSRYPVIKKPIDLKPGTSLCKLGYPFHEPTATFDQATNTFQLSAGTIPVPEFPIDSIFTRTVSAGKSKQGNFDIQFLETSSPGLRGQSGGPIFDVNGTVWAIQSRTQHFPLGFNPTVLINGKKIEEHQFLNVGWGIHPELIGSFLTSHNVTFQLSDY